MRAITLKDGSADFRGKQEIEADGRIAWVRRAAILAIVAWFAAAAAAGALGIVDEQPGGRRWCSPAS